MISPDLTKATSNDIASCAATASALRESDTDMTLAKFMEDKAPDLARKKGGE